MLDTAACFAAEKGVFSGCSSSTDSVSKYKLSIKKSKEIIDKKYNNHIRYMGDRMRARVSKKANVNTKVCTKQI